MKHGSLYIIGLVASFAVCIGCLAGVVFNGGL